MPTTRKRERAERIDRAFTKLADALEYGHLQAATDQAGFIEEAAQKLTAAMAVVEAVIAPLDKYYGCLLCEVVHPDDGGDWQHSDECVLVVGGFLTKEGKRL